MSSDTLGSERRAGRPILRLLASFPVACFTCALATDIAYTQTANMMWADFSAWLLAAGLAIGVLAAIAGVLGSVANRRQPRSGSSWPLFIGGLIVLVVALFDNLVHSRDAWTSVMPMGLILSVILVVVTFVTIWIGAARPERSEVGMQYSGARR